MSKNSLAQYIELYSSNRHAIDAHSAELLNSRRTDAFNSLAGAELPTKHTEGYERTSIADMFAPDYGVNVNRVRMPVDVASSFRCDVPNMSTLLGVVVNDEFNSTSNLDCRLPEGVLFMSLRRAACEYRDLVEQYYGRIAPMDQPVVALNTLLLQDGVFIYVPCGVKVDKPLQLVNIFSSATPLFAARRIVVAVEDNAELCLLICDHTQSEDTDFLSSQVVEIFVGENSRVDYYDIEESSARTSRHSRLYARQNYGSNLLVNGMTLSSGITRNDYNIDIAGERCETLLAGMAICSGSQHVDNNSQMNHLAGHCHSSQLFKYVLDDASTGAFEGSISVTPEAPFTEAYQSNRNLLASAKASMHTKPQLLIYNDEVKCSHGATTGQLDSEALFYMRTRGIPEEEARRMLMQAFMSDVIDTVRMQALRDRLRLLVEKRFQGQVSYCGDCSAASCREPHKD